MEYCEGGDLGSTIKKCRKTNTLLPEEMVWSYVSQMVSGLDACHYRGSHQPSTSGSISPTEEAIVPATAILHRDLKPENVFLDGNQNIKIGDFGLSKEVAAQSFACTYVGTPYYMSPELATGSPYDIKADIWALGCVAFELCALAPPFDARDQAELTRKIKLGHIPELPRGYSSDLGNLIRSMLDLNPKRRPTTKQLLREHPIRLACRTIELATMSRKIAAEKMKLRAQYYELEMREHAVSAREQEVVLLRQGPSDRQIEQEELQIALEKREKQVEAREREVEEREARLEVLLKNREEQKEKPVYSDDVVVGRERTSSSHHTVGSGIRRPIPRRVSSGTVSRVRPSPSGFATNWADGAVEVVHVKTNVITPRSVKAEAARQRFGKVGGNLAALGNIRASEKPSRRRMDSIGSEEWIDNDGDTEGPIKNLNISHGEIVKDVTARSRRRSNVSTPSASEATEEATERVSSQRSSRKSITALPPSARAWVNEVIKGGSEGGGGEEDISMRDASAFLAGEDKENQRHLEMGFEKCQSLPVNNLYDDTRASTRQPLAPRSTIASGEVLDANADGIAPPAIYDLSNDEDLPSPFLRKVTRHSNEALAKRGAKGNGLVGPTNFLARAAAAGAARQSMATLKQDLDLPPPPKIVAPLRRMSAANGASAATAAAATSRVSMPTSNSAVDVRSSERTAAPITKRRSSALPGSIGLSAASMKAGSNIAISSSSRKSCLPASVPIRQRAS